MIEMHHLKEDYSILRVDIFDHPLINASYEIRSGYLAVLYKCLIEMENKSPIIDEYFNLYLLQFQIRLEDIDLMKTASQDMKAYRYKLKLATKNYWYRTGFLRFTKGNYKFALFVDELMLYLYANEGSLSSEQIGNSAKKLRIGNKHATFLSDYCRSIHAKDSRISKAQLLSIKQLKLHNEIKFLYERLCNNLLVNTYEQFQVAVVSNMSAGKSTFINSIIGEDLFPSKNQACTAKWTSITNNPYLNHSIGRSNKKNTEIEYAGNITKDRLQHWNEDSEVESIELESAIYKIENDKTSIVLYDTPGTNFSQDISHGENTYKLLESRKFNLIIYLFNACNIATDDDRILLEKLKSILDDNPETAILFVLNKLDEFDLEKEDNFSETINELSEYLDEIGFKTRNIIPISAYAAKLFKLALKGSISTKKEIGDFEGLVKQFNEIAYDLSKLLNFEYKPNDVKQLENDSPIVINGNQYPSEQLLSLLKRTNIPLIDSYFKNLTTNYLRN